MTTLLTDLRIQAFMIQGPLRLTSDIEQFSIRRNSIRTCVAKYSWFCWRFWRQSSAKRFFPIGAWIQWSRRPIDVADFGSSGQNSRYSHCTLQRVGCCKQSSSGLAIVGSHYLNWPITMCNVIFKFVLWLVSSNNADQRFQTLVKVWGLWKSIHA